jgi:hypothetical protein
MPTLDFANLTYPISFGCRFGPFVMKPPDTDRYLMYWSGNFCVKNGKPVDASVTPGPYDPNTWNAGCNTFYGDRIWLTWHMGDGVDPAGWDADDGNGNKAPFLLLPAGGSYEESLVGDPTVIYWNSKWHLYYEGTNYCDGTNNFIFHATSDSWFGPWTKQGLVWGITGNYGSVGYSWPHAFVENGELYLYSTNSSQQLTCHKAIDSAGQYFMPMREGRPTQDDPCARGQVLAAPGGGYILVADVNNGKGLTYSVSNDKTYFPKGQVIADTSILGAASANSVGTPCAMLDNGKLRVYFTTRPNGTTVSSIGLAIYSL